MDKYAIIGRLAKNRELYDGQTTLTRMFKGEIEEQLNIELYCVDTFEYKKNFIKCFIKTIYSLMTCKKIFILLSKNGLSFYLPFLYYMNKIFKRKIYHRVIGGRLHILVKENKNWIKYLNSLEKNWVETEGMKGELINLGIENVSVSPNFKRIPILRENELYIKSNHEKNFYFCTFSRVTKEKGISDAIDAINKLSKKNKNVFLDIYGPIDESYKNEFFNKVKNAQNVSYKGIIDSTCSVEIIKKYYMLLFPTYWKGEGFPGTVIDAFSAGVPVLASNWNYNEEIIKNEYTGIIFDINNPNMLVEKIEYAINNEEFILSMKKNCILEAEKYTPNKVIREIINEIL